MATTTVYGNLINYTVFPTENDHYGAGGIGAGRAIQELTLAPLIGTGSMNRVVSGFSLPATGAGFTKDIAAGVAVINGYYISGAQTISVTLVASKWNHIFLALEFDGNSKLYRPTIKVIDTAINESPTHPANSTKLGHIVTDGSGSTANSDQRFQGRIVCGGVYRDDGSGPKYYVNFAGTNDWNVADGTGGFTDYYVITWDTPFFSPPMSMAGTVQALTTSITGTITDGTSMRFVLIG